MTSLPEATSRTPDKGKERSVPLSPMNVDEDDNNNNMNRVTNKDATGMPSSPPFHRDQRVWAQDPTTTHYYPATVRDLKWQAGTANAGTGEWKFRIHYQGWNSRWDRWLDASLIAQENHTEALRAAGLLSNSNNNNKATTSKENNDVENEESLVNNDINRKRKSDAESSSKSAGSTTTSSRKRRTARKLLPYADQCELPFTLQTVLIEEWERLTRPTQTCGKPPVRLVHTLPASVTVHQVLKHFAKKQKQEAANTENDAAGHKTPADIDAFCNGLSQLFQVSLPKVLLYNQERPQYEAMLRDPVLSPKPLTQVYGCEYLLRLYVRLPFLLPHVDESTGASIVGPLFAQLLVLMQKNRQACFKGDYRRPERDEWLETEERMFRAEVNHSMEEEEEEETATPLAS